MKVFLIMQTIIGDWIENHKDVISVHAGFESKELAEAFLINSINCPPIVLSGWLQEPEYEEETGLQIGVTNISQYESEAFYHIVECDILTATMHK